MPSVMPQELGLSPVHRIIETFSRAVEALGLGVPPLFVERWGVAVHQALSSRAREFHTHQHVLELVRDADAIETLAALYHDIVYVQVDLDVPQHYADILAPLLEKDAAATYGWRVLPHAAVDPTANDVLTLFGRKPGEVLTPFTQLNELASAFVAAKELEGVLTRAQLLAVIACIEATIPFRDEEGATLEGRLLGLGVGAEEARVMVRRAVRLSNNDVGNFADPDPGRFLDNTWKLLPETNPALHVPTTYSLRDYRVALMKMEAFLAHLSAKRVFHAWGGEPAPAEHTRRVESARVNIDLAVRYMRCKLYAVSLIEALALESGGDAPLPYFFGSTSENGGPAQRRLEQFLPAELGAADVNPVLRQLLQGGRATPSSFDVTPSPVAEYLYGSVGEKRLMQGFDQALPMWKGDKPPRVFLGEQVQEVVLAVAHACAEMAPTRTAALRELLKLLT